jgi:hypothetical protein
MRKKSQVGMPKSEVPKEVKAERIKAKGLPLDKQNTSEINIPH